LDLSRISAAERIVVVIYLFSIVCPLFGLVLGGMLYYSYGRQAFILFTVPFSTLFFLPFFHIAISPFLWPSTRALLFVVVGWLGLLLFYPVVSYLLWNRFRIGWALSLFAAVSTIGLSLYEALIEDLGEG
jgi:hypothetical protein